MSSVARLFLSIGGLTGSGVSGESVDESFKGKIELNSWSWNIQRKPKLQDTADRHGKYEPSVFSFTKPMDKSSTPLLNKLKSGELFMATLTLIEDSDHPFELSAYMAKARVTEYSLSGKDEKSSTELEESWTLSYDKIHFEHTWEPVKKSSKTVTSNSFWRRPDASTDSPDAVKKVVESFNALPSKSDKDDALARIKKEIGQSSDESRTSKSSAKVQELISAFEALGTNDKKKVREAIG
jgi:type VI protein secretion system component Hcp